MNYDTFYHFRITSSANPELEANRKKYDFEDYGEWAHFWCSLEDNCFRAEITPNEPPYFLYKKKGKLKDCIGEGLRWYLFHERVVNIFNKEGVSGIKFIPTEIEHKKEKRVISEYFALQITGRRGDRDKSRGQLAEHTYPWGDIHKEWQGMYFINDEHDGSDFVIGRRDSHVVVSQKVKEICKTHKITGCTFTVLPEWWHPSGSV